MTRSVHRGLREEFRRENFGLIYDKPGHFARAQCGRGISLLYLTWRCIWALYHICVIGLCAHYTKFLAINEESRLKYMLIFVSLWSFYCLTITSAIELVVAVYFYSKRRNELTGAEGPMPWYCKTLWTFLNVSYNSGLIVSMLYWVLLYKPYLGLEGYRSNFFLLHGMNFIYIVMDLSMTAIPIRLLHVYQTLIWAVIYLVFNCVYVTSGGSSHEGKPYIYAFMDWNVNPGLSAGISAGCLVAVLLSQGVLYCIYRLRVHVVERAGCSHRDVGDSEREIIAETDKVA